jgi:hypothetical protein
VPEVRYIRAVWTRFHAGNTGSNPVGDARISNKSGKLCKRLICRFFFANMPRCRRAIRPVTPEPASWGLAIFFLVIGAYESGETGRQARRRTRICQLADAGGGRHILEQGRQERTQTRTQNAMSLRCTAYAVTLSNQVYCGAVLLPREVSAGHVIIALAGAR